MTALAWIVLTGFAMSAIALMGSITLLLKKAVLDRIIMPLPKDAETFLDIAFIAGAKGTMIHLYAFLSEAEIGAAGKERIRAAAAAAGKKCTIKRVTRCGQQSPHTYRVCYDVLIR